MVHKCLYRFDDVQFHAECHRGAICVTRLKVDNNDLVTEALGLWGFGALGDLIPP